MKEYISPVLYHKILFTYPDACIENVWNPLLVMVEIFSDLVKEVIEKSGFGYNFEEGRKVKAYLE